MYGTQETEDLLIFVAKLGNAIEGSLEDGVINFMDIDEIFSPAAAAKSAFEGSSQIPNEIGDLDSTEASNLVEVFAEELDLAHTQAEQLTTEGLAVATALIAYINKLRNLRNA